MQKQRKSDGDIRLRFRNNNYCRKIVAHEQNVKI